MAEIDNIRYIIMCGGEYNSFETPRQLSVIRGEELVARTIRLLKENGIKDIAISSNNPIFEKFGLPVLRHNNPYVVDKENKVVGGQWFDAFYPTEEPVCYIFGDVYFSENAIKTIVKTKTDDIELFGSKPPYDERYIKTHEEPFALKVMNTKHLKEAIEKSRELDAQHKFWRKPIVWELFTVIKNAPLQTKRNCYTTDYVGISDYSCDIDRKNDIMILEIRLGGDMVKLEAKEDFSLGRFNEVIDLVRYGNKKDDGMIYKGDVFKCNKDLAEYLCGNNPLNRPVVNILEVEEVPIEEKEINIKNTATINKDIPTTQGLDVVTTYKQTTKKRIKKSKR